MVLHKKWALFVGGFLLTFTPMFAAGSQSIRDVDLKAYIIKRDDLAERCKEISGRTGENRIHFWEVEYADLDGDGKEEAVVEAATCAMGTGGCDIAEVLKRLPSGEIVKLNVTQEGYTPPAEYDGMGSTPRLDGKDGKLIGWYIMYAKEQGRPKSGWIKTLTYRWNKNVFVVDHVTETPPLHPEDYK